MKKKLSIRRVAVRKHNSRKHIVQRGGVGNEWNIIAAANDYIKLNKESNPQLKIRTSDATEIPLSVVMTMTESNMNLNETAWAIKNKIDIKSWIDIVNQMSVMIQSSIRAKQNKKYDNIKSSYMEIRYKIYNKLLALYLRCDKTQSFFDDEKEWIRVGMNILRCGDCETFRRLLTIRTDPMQLSISIPDLQLSVCNTLGDGFGEIRQLEELGTIEYQFSSHANVLSQFRVSIHSDRGSIFSTQWLAFVKHMRVMVNNHSNTFIDNILDEMIEAVRSSTPMETNWKSNTEQKLDTRLEEITSIQQTEVKLLPLFKDTGIPPVATTPLSEAERHAQMMADSAQYKSLFQRFCDNCKLRFNSAKECFKCQPPYGGGRRKKTSRKKKGIRTKNNRRK